MKKVVIILSSVLLMFAFIGCQKKTEEKAAAKAPVVEAPKALEGVDINMLAIQKCAGCGMDMNEHAITDTMTYEGKLYGFCSSGCKDHFKADPVAALAKLDEKKMDDKKE